MLIFLVAHIDP